jgi:hypothetical protein
MSRRDGEAAPGVPGGAPPSEPAPARAV